MIGKPRAYESEAVIATVARGAHKEVQVRRCCRHDGLVLVDVRVWKLTWRGPVPSPNGTTLLVDEAPAVAAALLQAGGSK